ncbi:hypothetical protein K0B04_03225 [Patescibacteria group bacterium]|nr:hypothetical protein [Patescibacteria group bacterium]
MKKILKVFIILLVVVVIIIFGISLFSKILLINRSKSIMSSSENNVHKAPITNHNVNVSYNSDYLKTYNHKKISVSTDWVDTYVSETNETLSITFEDDKFIIINGNPSNINYYDAVITESVKSGKQEIITSALEKRGIRSNKDIYDYMVKLSAEDFSLSKSIDELALNYILLVTKVASLPDCSKILIYSNKNLSFYQYNTLSTKSTISVIDFFDDSGNLYSITIGSPTLTQSEIDKLVSTIIVK